MSKILIIGQVADGKLNAGVAKVVAAAKMIGGEITIALFGASVGDAAAQAAKLDGVTKVLKVERADNDSGLAAVLAPQIVELAAGYTHLLFPGTTFGKDLAPRVAAKLDVQQLSDIMAVHSATSFDRPIYAGNAIVTVEAPAGLVLATVRLASFAVVGETGSAAIESSAPAPLRRRTPASSSSRRRRASVRTSSPPPRSFPVVARWVAPRISR